MNTHEAPTVCPTHGCASPQRQSDERGFWNGLYECPTCSWRERPPETPAERRAVGDRADVLTWV